MVRPGSVTHRVTLDHKHRSRSVERFDKSVIGITANPHCSWHHSRSSNRLKSSAAPVLTTPDDDFIRRERMMITNLRSITPLEVNAVARNATEDSPPRTLDKRLVHKSYDENVLVSHIEAVRGPNKCEEGDNAGAMDRTDHFRGVLCVHHNHPFFFRASERPHTCPLSVRSPAADVERCSAYVL